MTISLKINSKPETLKEISISLILLIPILLYYFAYFYHHSVDLGFGFLVGDMPSYMANARQHFDENVFHLLYSNPFNISNEGPNIYFQLHTLLLGVIWKISGFQMGIIFMSFGFLCSFFAIWLSLKFFKTYLGWGKLGHLLTFIIFIYGGGILIISGFMYSLINGYGFQQSILNCKIFDPDGGFWMLNYGRNFIFPTEAYYHLLSIGIVFATLKQKHYISSLILFLLAISHPFYGIQFLLILISWQVFERLFFKNYSIKSIPIILNLFTFSLFVYYYAFYLNNFPEHRIIVEQWSLNWVLKLKNIFPAYGILIVILIYQIRNKDSFVSYFKNPFRRFLLVYALFSFLLANHELFIKPIQPIHFTHGHIYIPLFLLITEPILNFFLKKKSKFFIAFQLLIFVLLIFDNLSWFPGQSYVNINSTSAEEMSMLKNQEDIINFINKNYDSSFLLASDNEQMEYYSTVYSSINALVPHPANTPFIEKKQTIENELFQKNNWDVLPNYKLIVVDDLKINGMEWSLKLNNNFIKIFKNQQYIVYLRKN